MLSFFVFFFSFSFWFVYRLGEARLIRKYLTSLETLSAQLLRPPPRHQTAQQHANPFYAMFGIPPHGAGHGHDERKDGSQSDPERAMADALFPPPSKDKETKKSSTEGSSSSSSASSAAAGAASSSFSSALSGSAAAASFGSSPLPSSASSSSASSSPSPFLLDFDPRIFPTEPGPEEEIPEVEEDENMSDDEDEESGQHDHHHRHRRRRRARRVDDQVNILYLLFGLPSLKSLHIRLHRLAPLLFVLRNWKGQQHSLGGEEGNNSMGGLEGGLLDEEGGGLDAVGDFGLSAGAATSASSKSSPYHHHLRSTLEKIRLVFFANCLFTHVNTRLSSFLISCNCDKS